MLRTTPAGTSGAQSLAWAPDGRHLAVLLSHTAGPRGRGIYALDVRTGSKRPLLLLAHGPLGTVSWSDDGRTMLVAGSALTLLDLRSGRVTVVGSGSIDASLSPDGRLVAYSTTADGNGNTSDGSDSTRPTSELHVMRADGTHDRRLTDSKDLDDDAPAWADRNTLLFVRGGKDIARLDLPTLRTRLLTHPAGYDADVAAPR